MKRLLAPVSGEGHSGIPTTETERQDCGEGGKQGRLEFIDLESLGAEALFIYYYCGRRSGPWFVPRYSPAFLISNPNSDMN